ncbi:hypothetical protein LZ31DRAFT_601538 [Colletotrichum somersetense]|nr:hypothetical protein LZ31DRAFT_601538 [Colletotrichum somersetense]
MHLVSGEITELPLSAADGRRRKELAGKRSGMPANLARPLASYITSVFQSPELLGKGTTFQKIFIDGWADWVGSHRVESFWRKHVPAFHAYDYSANIKIETS